MGWIVITTWELKASKFFYTEMLQIDGSPRDTKETHGRRNDIDENTPLDEVKAPNVFERMKEEIEALVQTIQAK